MNSYDIYQRSAMKMESTTKNITCSGKIGKTYYEYDQGGGFESEISQVGRIPFICRKLFLTDFNLTYRDISCFVLYVANGSAQLVLDSESLLISKGDVIILNNANNRKQMISSSMPVDVIMLWCEGSLPMAYCKHMNNKKIHIYNQDTLVELFDKTAYFCQEHTAVCEARVLSLISQFFCLVSEEALKHSNAGKPKIPEGIERTIALIENEYNTDINMNALVQISGFSEPHFYRMFRKSTGMTPNQYLINQRIHAAKTLLAASNYQVKFIASLVGYSSVSHFIEHFRKHTSLTPNAYREQQRNSGVQI